MPGVSAQETGATNLNIVIEEENDVAPCL